MKLTLSSSRYFLSFLEENSDEFFADFLLLELSLKNLHKTNADKIYNALLLYIIVLVTTQNCSTGLLN